MTLRTIADQSGKQILCQALGRAGLFTSEKEVVCEPERADGCFVPSPGLRWALPEGLLGRMSRQACMFELFSKTPGDQTLVGCVLKGLIWQHTWVLGNGRKRALPRLWVISAGHPFKGFKQLRAGAKQGWPDGVYDIAPGFRTGFVVASELPERRSTLMVRLLGQGKTFDRAKEELLALPEQAWEREMAVPILVKYGLVKDPNAKVSPKKAQWLKQAEEYFTKWEEWERKNNASIDAALDKGFKAGREKGFKAGQAKGFKAGEGQGRQDSLFDLYKVRFGRVPRALQKAVEQAPDELTLRRWFRLVAKGTQDDIARVILNGAPRA